MKALTWIFKDLTQVEDHLEETEGEPADAEDKRDGKEDEVCSPLLLLQLRVRHSPVCLDEPVDLGIDDGDGEKGQNVLNKTGEYRVPEDSTILTVWAGLTLCLRV